MACRFLSGDGDLDRAPRLILSLGGDTLLPPVLFRDTSKLGALAAREAAMMSGRVAWSTRSAATTSCCVGPGVWLFDSLALDRSRCSFPCLWVSQWITRVPQVGQRLRISCSVYVALGSLGCLSCRVQPRNGSSIRSGRMPFSGRHCSLHFSRETYEMGTSPICTVHVLTESATCFRDAPRSSASPAPMPAAGPALMGGPYAASEDLPVCGDAILWACKPALGATDGALGLKELRNPADRKPVAEPTLEAAGLIGGLRNPAEPRAVRSPPRG